MLFADNQTLKGIVTPLKFTSAIFCGNQDYYFQKKAGSYQMISPPFSIYDKVESTLL